MFAWRVACARSRCPNHPPRQLTFSLGKQTSPRNCLKEAAYVEIIHAAPSLLCFDTFIGIDVVLCGSLKQTNQAQSASVRLLGIACKEPLEIAQGQLRE